MPLLFVYIRAYMVIIFLKKEVFTMVKGVSRQVIVVQSPDRELFEQAIFILTDAAVEKGVTEQMLLKQANQAIRTGGKRKNKGVNWAPLWAGVGAGITGIVWLITHIL